MNKEKLDKIFNEMSEAEQKEFRAALYGMSVSEMEEIERVSTESKKLIDLPIEDWPPFEIIWDLNSEHFYYAFDGSKEEDFHKLFPEGVILAWADLKELDSKFTRQSQRTIDETWTHGFPDKTASCLLFWIEGKKMTPPFIEIYDHKHIYITGGHHRLAICRAKLEKRVPFLTMPKYKERMSEILTSVKWEDSY